jgi:hypothetical protein
MVSPAETITTTLPPRHFHRSLSTAPTAGSGSAANVGNEFILLHKYSYMRTYTGVIEPHIAEL